MKILQLRFKNLNSLRGEWLIDFTAADFVGNGIFALTGPTGAGKSTILDAVSLALYGATPRLGRISKGGNEIISRQCGDCYAEVVFKTVEGRFRCHWQQRRSRKRADGALQSPEHQIAEAESGRLLESKLSATLTLIEQKSGMDFKRFTRSMLLAQGGFDSFLRADPEDKSRILEQITGAEIYSEISRRAHKRWREERLKLQQLQEETKGITVFDSDEEERVGSELRRHKHEAENLDEQAAQTLRAINWREAMRDIEQTLMSLDEQLSLLQTEDEKFQAERGRLKQALKAAALDGQYAAQLAWRKQLADDQAARKEKLELLSRRKLLFGQTAKKLAESEQQSIQAAKKRKESSMLIREVRALDQKLDLERKQLAEWQLLIDRNTEKIADLGQKRQRQQQDIAAAETALGDVERYLIDHFRDERLTTSLAGIEEQLKTLSQRQQESSRFEIALTETAAAVDAADLAIKNGKSELSQQKSRLKDAEEKLEHEQELFNAIVAGHRLAELRSKKETLLREMSLLNRIAELEQQRQQLTDGQPCPLCGATIHPFAHGNEPPVDATEQKISALTDRIEQAEQQESTIRQLEQQVNRHRQQLTVIQQEAVAADSRKQAVDKNHADRQKQLQQSRQVVTAQQQEIHATLNDLDISGNPESPQQLIDELRQKADHWRQKREQKNELTTRLTAAKGELTTLDSVIGNETQRLDENMRLSEAIRQEIDTDGNKRQHLFAYLDPDEEEQRLDSAVATAEQCLKQATEEHDRLRQQLALTESHIETYSRRINDAQNDKSEEHFASAVAQAGFADEQNFIAARLTPEERETLADRSKNLEQRFISITARRQDYRQKLAAAIDKKISDMSLPQLGALAVELSQKQSELKENIGRIEHLLAENSAARQQIAQNENRIENRKQQLSLWQQLYTLIGSEDGKKYRNFAQGLTFELVVSHANRQLAGMTDRYLLIRDTEQPLRLNVIDNYQAGEIRSTQNLSGGESFIISLSLALGLSQMSSNNVRVDSLFLDEGFGSLDEETLETALTTLAGLRQDGKLIGVISHIAALKERIQTHISIIPTTGGRSLISGPGCRRLDHG